MDNDKERTIHIQDLLVGKAIIPHRVELGYPDEAQSTLVEVRRILVPVRVHLREGVEFRFTPDNKKHNIEYIINTCTLLHDLLEMDKMDKLIPPEPQTEVIDVSEWHNYISTDTLPERWFLRHRNAMVLKVNVHVQIHDDKTPDIKVKAGTSWGDLFEVVNRCLSQIELQADQAALKERKPKDYKAVRSSPAVRPDNAKDSSEPARHLDDTFLSIAGEILTNGPK